MFALLSPYQLPCFSTHASPRLRQPRCSAFWLGLSKLAQRFAEEVSELSQCVGRKGGPV